MQWHSSDDVTVKLTQSYTHSELRFTAFQLHHTSITVNFQEEDIFNDKEPKSKQLLGYLDVVDVDLFVLFLELLHAHFHCINLQQYITLHYITFFNVA